MAYVQFEPGFTQHSKRLQSGPLASWVWTCMVDLSAILLTDGFVSQEHLQQILQQIPNPQKKRVIQALINTRSIAPRFDSSGKIGGYVVHDYLEHNPSAEQVKKEKAQGRERYRRWRDKRIIDTVSDAVANASANAFTNASANGAILHSFIHSKETPPKSPNGGLDFFSPKSNQATLNPDGSYPASALGQRDQDGHVLNSIEGVSNEYAISGAWLEQDGCPKREFLGRMPPDARRRCRRCEPARDPLKEEGVAW